MGSMMAVLLYERTWLLSRTGKRLAKGLALELGLRLKPFIKEN
jgi:hypothetical protein